MKFLNKNITFVLYLFASYMLILAFRGFEFASSDMVEVINYAKHMINPDLFVNDFYVSHISKVVPNERIVFSSFLKLLIVDFECCLFIVHFLLTITMLIGLYRISSLYIKQEVFKWLMIMILFGPLYKINLGGNELYYNMLISSFVAKVFGVWAIYFYLRLKRTIAILLILLSTLVHPTVGSQLFIVVFLSMLFERIKGEKNSLSGVDLISILLYLVFAGGYIFLLLRAVHDFGIDKELYFEIFEFRVPHHFYPQYFPLKNYAIELSLFLIGLGLMINLKMRKLLNLSLVILFGILVYLVGVYNLKIPFVLNTQWFKTTIWLELFAMIALMKYLDNKVKLKFESLVFYGFTVSSMLIWILIGVGNSYFAQKSYQFCQKNDLNDEEQLAERVKEGTDKNDIFVWPIDFSGFKYYSERGAFVDYKSVVHRGTVLRKWYNRIKMVYGIDLLTRRTKRHVKQTAIENYRKMNDKSIAAFKTAGIDYIIQYSDVNLNLPLILKTDKYKVYKVK